MLKTKVNYMNMSKLSPVKLTNEIIEDKLNKELVEGTRNRTVVWDGNSTMFKGRKVEFKSWSCLTSTGGVIEYWIMVHGRRINSNKTLEQAIIDQRNNKFLEWLEG